MTAPTSPMSALSVVLRCLDNPALSLADLSAHTNLGCVVRCAPRCFDAAANSIASIEIGVQTVACCTECRDTCLAGLRGPSLFAFITSNEVTLQIVVLLITIALFGGLVVVLSRCERKFVKTKNAL